MIKIEETTIQNGPHIKKGYKAVPQEGNSDKDVVRFHIDSEVGDIFDLLADMSKMIWVLNRKIDGNVEADDAEIETKLKGRMQQVDDIISQYYNK
jgi:hypothetical protein